MSATTPTAMPAIAPVAKPGVFDDESMAAMSTGDGVADEGDDVNGVVVVGTATEDDVDELVDVAVDRVDEETRVDVEVEAARATKS
jgi:hypothetical protein